MNSEGIFKIGINESLVLYEKEDGLKFGTDAYLLYAYMRKNSRAVAADFGSGTGVISLLSASKNKFSKIFACEIQHEFCEIIRLNTCENNLDGTIKTLECNVCNLSSKDFGGEIDVVFTNPPYMTSSDGKLNRDDRKSIARHEINGDIHAFVTSASRVLKYGGLFYIVYRPNRLSELFAALKISNLEPKRLTFVHHTSLAGPSLVLIEAKKGAKPSLFVTKPLILCNSDGSDSEDTKYIYENGDFNEQFKKS